MRVLEAVGLPARGARDFRLRIVISTSFDKIEELESDVDRRV